MRTFVVKALNVTGRGNKVYEKGMELPETKFPPNSCDKLVEAGFLEELDTATKTDFNKSDFTFKFNPFTRNTSTVIYTCSFGNYDTIEPVSSPYDCLLFTDQDVKVSGWKTIKCDYNGVSPRRASRYLKINSHLLGYKKTIYVDARVRVRSPLNSLDLDFDLGIYNHFSRTCLYEEARAVLGYGMDDPTTVNNQVNRYKNEGFPPDYGLYECGLMVRDSSKVKEFEKIWWKEYLKGSQRDQISFPYAVWKSGIKLSKLPMGKDLRKTQLALVIHRKKKH